MQGSLTRISFFWDKALRNAEAFGSKWYTVWITPGYKGVKMVPLLSKSRLLLSMGCCCSSWDWLEKGVLLHAKINAKMNWHIIMFLSVVCKGAVDVTGGLWCYKTQLNWLAFSKFVIKNIFLRFFKSLLLQKIDSVLKHLPKIKWKKAMRFCLSWHRTALKYTVEALKVMGKSGTTYLLFMLVCCTKRSH